MMKPGLVIALIVGIIIILVGAYFLTTHRSYSPAMQNTYVVKPTQSSNIFSSIQDALARSLSLKCDYTYKDIHTVAYIKNGQIRSDVISSTNPQVAGSTIIKVNDKKIYYWNPAGMGFVMAMPDMSVSVSPPPATSPSSSSSQNTVSNLEQYKQYCHPATVDDSLFALPTNITFKDMTQMMQAMPTNGTAPSGYTIPTQYQQYMPH